MTPSTHVLIVRRIREGCRQRWRLRMLKSSRRMVKFSTKAQNSEKRFFKPVDNRESCKH